MAVRFRLFAILSCLPLLGSSCLFAQRPHTFIPPTSLQGECGTVQPYFYSTIFQFCLPAPNENWERISVSLPLEILGTSITTFSFFSIEENQKVFTLYLAEPTEANKTIYEREQIPILHPSPYLVGYTLNPDNTLPPDLQNLQLDVEEMVKNITFQEIAIQ